MKDNNSKKTNEKPEVDVKQFGSMTRDDIGILGKNGSGKSQKNAEKQQVSIKQPRRDMGDFL